MSAESLQSALINLVRFPEHNRAKDLDAFMARFELTNEEKWQVRSLASSYYVAKFGRDQRSDRFDISIKGILPLTVRLITAKIMARDIFGRRFEPEHPVLGVADIARTFGRYFIKHAEEIQKEFGLPIHIVDLAKYEFAEYLVKGKVLQAEWQVPEGSLLTTSSVFSIAELKHDILGYVEKAKGLSDEALRELIPEQGNNIVLLAKVPKPGADEDTHLVHQFLIDEELKTFLIGQQGTPLPEKPTLPPCYGDLVELGLCRPLN